MTNYIVENGVKTSAFGEQLVVIPFPTIQFDPVYGLRHKTDTKVLADAAGAGSVALNTNSNGTKEFKISSGTGANSYCILQSQRTVRYRPGQGMRFQFTARFTQGVAGNTQSAGAFNFGNEIAFGYNGTSFGILYRSGGLPEIRTLTVTVGAGGNENATVTLNGVAKVVAVTAGSATLTAATLAAASYPGWEVSSVGALVTFVAQNDTAFSGAFTLTSNGTTDGTIATTSAGLTSTSTWIPRSQWNVDHCDGTGASGFNLDPTKGNVYEIKVQYLGYGQIYFTIEDEVGRMIMVHKINYPNTNITPSFSLPHFKAGYTSRNTTNTTSISLFAASFAGFIDGDVRMLRNYDSRSFSKANIGTSSTPILSIRNRLAFNNTWNLTTLELHRIVGAIEGAKPGIIEVIINATLTGAAWTSHEATSSIVEYDTTATALTLGANGQVLRSLPLAKSDSGEILFETLSQVLESTDSITIAAKASSTTVDVSVAVSWHED
ncbi:MAG: hypothetical protein HW379_1602 [Actinobacteria bacterium]|nr:hypothetical protein [Actinomycetota bacterium]